MEGEEGDLVAAAIMAMQQTDTEQGSEASILQVVAQAECPADGHQVENQIMVQSDGEIIVQPHAAAALQNLQHHHQQQQLQQQHQSDATQTGQHQVQGEVMVGAAAPLDPRAMGVEIQDVNVLQMHAEQSTCVTEASDGTIQRGMEEKFLHVNYCKVRLK